MSLSELLLWRELETALDEVAQLVQYQRTRAALEDCEHSFLPHLTEVMLLLVWVIQRVRDGHLADGGASLARAEAQLQDLKEGI